MTSLSPVLKQATPVVVDHARGSWIYGTDGREYLDFTTGIGVTSTGHCHPEVVAAAQDLPVHPHDRIHALGIPQPWPLFDPVERMLGRAAKDGKDRHLAQEGHAVVAPFPRCDHTAVKCQDDA